MEHRPWHDAYDAGVPPEIPFRELPIAGYVPQAARQHAGRAAWRFGNASMTYENFGDEVARLATALATLGVEKGTRVAILLPNLPQVPIAYHAVMALGAVCVLTNPLYTPRELEHQWGDAGCEVAIVADFLFERTVRGIRGKLPIKHYLVASIAEYLKPPLKWIAPFALRKKGLTAKVAYGDGVHPFRAVIRGTTPDPPQVDVFPDDLAVLQYTGGTTGVSKGAMLTHRNLSCNAQQCDAWFTTAEHGQEVALCALPLFHVFGMTVTMNYAIYSGATMVLLPDPRDVGKIIDTIEKHGVTFLPGVPAMFNAINSFEGIGGRDLSSVKLCISGSAPLPRDVQERFEKLSGGIIIEGFGLTETSPVTHANPIQGTRKIGTIGLPLPNTDVRIVAIEDPARQMPPGEEGELVIRGPQVMPGYWNRPEETEKSLRGGWFLTGDLATVDAEGYFRIVGRKKDMIIAGGYNIYPDEVDDVLTSHESVQEAATIGVPDERRGETVKSFVVLAKGRSATPEELERHCRANLAAYKIPREFEFLDELPKSSVLKVLRRELRERELAKRKQAAGG
jgi:long-chain acyl-CoA synthetase